LKEDVDEVEKTLDAEELVKIKKSKPKKTSKKKGTQKRRKK